jgi:hypothetical protein
MFDFGFVLAGGDQQAGGGRILHCSISPTRCKHRKCSKFQNLYNTEEEEIEVIQRREEE